MAQNSNHQPHQHFVEPELGEKQSSSLWKFLTWSSASLEMLRAAEKKILSYLKTPFRGWYVDLGSCIGREDKIWTLSFNNESKATPLLLVHGLGAGVALWVLNLDDLAKNRSVYAIDMLGFGRSARPAFATDALKAEKQFVKSIEEWRREMNLDKMIVLGHSMGGYLAASYAIEYPERVQHLILADAWGFPERPAKQENTREIPLWIRALVFTLKPMNPLFAVRAAGPWGQWVVEKTRPDILNKFTPVVTEDTHSTVAQYIHQCNSQTPTGESAFHTMCGEFGYAKNPMINRIHEVREDISITMIYGSRSWVDYKTGDAIKNIRMNSYVDVKIINGAGHHVYADKSDVFNEYVIEACEVSDKMEQQLVLPTRQLKGKTATNADVKKQNENDEDEHQANDKNGDKSTSR